MFGGTLDAHVCKRHVASVRSVDGSRGDVLVAPGLCDVRSHCRSVSAFQRWTCVDDVLGVVDHFARNYGGGEVWYVVGVRADRPPFLFFVFVFVCSIPVRGDVSGNINRAT